jgi:N,N-dimethylformamidase
MSSVRPTIFGYPDRWYATPGETISFHVSTSGLDSYRSQLVQLFHGHTSADGPGFRETVIPSAIDAKRPGRSFGCAPGSFVEIDDAQGLLNDLGDYSIEVVIFPTLPQGTRSGRSGAYGETQSAQQSGLNVQAIAGNFSKADKSGCALVLSEGRPEFIWSEGGVVRKIGLKTPLLSHQWYHLRVSLDRTAGQITIEKSPISSALNRYSDAAANIVAESASDTSRVDITSGDAPFRIGALARRDGDRWLPESAFNGKIGAVKIAPANGGAALADWHFGRSNRADGLLLRKVIDGSANGLHGHCHNGAVRAVTGHRFTGHEGDFRTAPDAFDAIHFHDDAVGDVEWPAAFEYVVPEDLSSGVYAVRLSGDEAEYHIPFFVGAGARKNRVAVLFSTATYLAYANDRVAFEASEAEIIIGHPPVIDPLDRVLHDHPEFGKSCYGSHNDGIGVVMSSLHRPILTVQPRHRAWFQTEGVWSLPADLCIVNWLDHIDCPFDAITDEALDAGGAAMLQDYDVLITGSHPEYVTRNELAAIEAFTANGGRLMTLGGNCFFATVSFDPEGSHLLELRRADSGTRPHQTPIGSRRHATSGEMAGLWRNKGLAPQRITGLGFIAQGFDRSTYYERLEDSFHPLAQFVFEGIDPDERLGDFGFMGGGAAGAEIDCYDPNLGSPPDTLVLATSGPFSDGYLLAAEEIYESIPGIGGTEQASVRADIVLCPLASGGGMFSVGSIAYTAALSHNGYANNIARMTGNVLRRFLDPAPLNTIPG